MAQYHLARDGKQLGTFSENELTAGLGSGRFHPDDLIWTEGMADWQPARTRFQAPASVALAPAPAGGGVYNPYAAPVAGVLPGVAAGNLPLASLGTRFGAAMLDFLAFFLFVGIPYGVMVADIESSQGSSNGMSPVGMIALGILGVASLALMIINIVMLTTRGQTIGKRMLGIRIVTHPDCQKPGFVKAVLLRSVVNSIIGAVPCLGGIYSLVDICFIFQNDRRCIHDQIAGTQVVEGNPPA